MTKPRFITFEGGEGAGKSTQLRRLLQRLAAAGIEAIATREPGGSPFAEQVRRFILGGDAEPHGALAETLLFTAARADHLEKTIQPAMQAGRWVVCDRFIDSTRAYQGAAGGLAGETLLALERLVLGDVRPDLTVILDVPAAEGLRRAGRRLADSGSTAAADPYEARGLAFHETLRAGFLAIAQAEPDRCVVVDGLQREDDIEREIWQVVSSRLLGGGA